MDDIIILVPLITVPYGRYHNFGTFQHFDRALLQRAIDMFETDQIAQTYFRHSADGWQFSEEKACADAEYVDWVMTPPDKRPASFPDHPDRAAAARAVACLVLFKSG